MRSPDRGPGELGLVELLRWAWRQLISMRTALLLLLLLALAAVPGSIVPQSGVDSLAASRWKDDHPTLTPIYERLGLFSVYDSAWFSAIYLLLIVSLVGCILPRTAVYWRALRAAPPRAPRRLDRLPDHASYSLDGGDGRVLDSAEEHLRGRRFRVVRGRDDDGGEWVSAERGYLREAGNLLFHVSVVVVAVGFAIGGLFGYQGGAIVLVGGGFTNTATQYDELDPGSLFDADDLDPFRFTIEDFDLAWVTSGPAKGQARSFVSRLAYTPSPGADEASYDLRVNHPLTIDDTQVFLIGHGYAPVITIRDGDGEVAYSGPTVFLPRDQTFRSFGVVKAPDASPAQVGLTGELYPTYAFTDETGPFSVMGDDLNPALSMTLWTGDLGLDDGTPQSVYALDTDSATQVLDDEGNPVRVDLMLGDTVELPDGLGTVSFDRLERWNKLQISQTPGKFVALGGVVLALVGLMGSLFIRPRRVWVRVRPSGADGTLVEAAALDRSGNADVGEELTLLARRLGLDERKSET